MNSLNLFYEEPAGDRWLPLDRIPRRFIRHLVRGKPRVGGQQRVFLNLCAGLDRLGVPYRVNDYRHARNHPDEVACVIGKPLVLDKMAWQNPIVFGAAVFSHPSDCPELLHRYPIRKVLVPGEWMRRMFEPAYGRAVQAWPVGIDTDLWNPAPMERKDVDVLLYDKVRWERDRYAEVLLGGIHDQLRRRGLRVEVLRYGYYEEEEYHDKLERCRAMIFLCEHETQGIAYQQALACGVPLFAWDRGGFWQDPKYYPHIERFGPVSSVPYWDDRCGLKFADADEFAARIDEFLDAVSRGRFAGRDYVLENLTLERRARKYLEALKDVGVDVAEATTMASRHE